MIDCGALLFDLDGTLVDSAHVLERTWTTWASIHNLNAADVVAFVHGRRAIETVQHFVPGSNLLAEVARVQGIELSELESILPMPGAMETLDVLTPKQWAVVSSGSRALAIARLVAAGLETPPVLITAEDVGRGKPDPEGYLAAALRLGVDPMDCIVLEDSPSGVKAGKLAGCVVIGIASTHRPDELSAADGIVPSLTSIRFGRKDGRVALTLRSH